MLVTQVLILAHRYGTVSEGLRISVTEMEYNRAIERGIPRLCFVIDKTHPLADFTMMLATSSLKVAQEYEPAAIRAARLQGTTALGLDDFAQADEHLHHALTRA